MGIGVYHFVELHKSRVAIKEVARDAFEDKEWGLGQMMSVFAWIPLEWEVIKLLLSKFYPITELFLFQRVEVLTK